MENTKVKSAKMNWWALLASFLFGAVLGFFLAPIKKGMIIGSYNGSNNSRNDDSDDCDFYSDYYDDFDDDDENWEDETRSYSF